MTTAPELPWKVGEERDVMNIVFRFAVKETRPGTPSRYYWHGWPLAHNVMVSWSAVPGRGWTLSVSGVAFYGNQLDKALYKAVKWRITQINTWRREIEAYDAAVRAADVKELLAHVATLKEKPGPRGGTK